MDGISIGGGHREDDGEGVSGDIAEQDESDVFGAQVDPHGISVTGSDGGPEVAARVNESSRKSIAVMPGSDEYLCQYVFKEGKIAKGLKAKHIRFLNAVKDSENLEDCCKRSGMSLDDFRGLCQRQEFREILEDRFKEVAIRRGITAEWLASEAVKVWDGTSKKDFQQMIVWKELMARVWPREKVGGSDSGKVNININLDRLAEAKERILDAETVESGTTDPEG